MNQISRDTTNITEVTEVVKTLAQSGFTSNQIERVIKALPSQPVWTQLQPDFGYWDGDRTEMLKLLAFYQKNPIVHGAIAINANGITAARPTLMKIVNKGAKRLAERGFKRLANRRLKKIRKQWAEASLHRKSLSDDQELVEVTDHPHLDALHSNDQDQTFHSLLRLIGVSLDVYGIAFAAKVRDNLGRVTSYRYLPAYNVSPQRDGNGMVIGWFYCDFGGIVGDKQPIAKEDMIVFRWSSLSDPHAGGDSRLKSAIRKLELSGKWTDYMDWIVTNRARPDWMFIPKGGTNPDAAARDEKKIGDKFRGPGNGRVAIGEQDGAIVPLNWSPTDLAPLKFDDELKQAILFALGVPEAFFTSDSNKATAAAAQEQWARQSLAPTVAVLESVLNAEARTYDEQLIWVFENVIPEDESQDLAEETFELTKWNQALISDAITKDEYREHVLGLEPMPEEEKPDPQQVPVQTIDEQVEDEGKEEDEADAEDTDEDRPKALNLLALNTKVAKGLVDRSTAINLVAYSLKLSQAEARNLVTHVHRKARKTLPKLHPMDHSHLKAAIVRCMDRQKTHYLKQLTGNHPTKGLSGLDDTDLITKSVDLPDRFSGEGEWDAEDATLYKPFIHLQATETANARTNAYKEIGVAEDAFGAVPQHVEASVAKSTLRFAESTNSTTESDLNEALKQLRGDLAKGVIEGDPIPAMKKKVEAIFENIASERADLIARTEISRAMHESQRMTAKASGIVKGFKLLASSECCDGCAEIDGKEIGLNEKFDSEDDYDDSMLPVHPNCRCTALEVLDLDALDD